MILAIVIVGGNILVHQIPTVSGHYSYVVSITGLSGYQGDPVTEFVVPVPAVRGSPVFSEEELQGIGPSGNWTSVPVMTDGGIMLALRSSGTDLTDTFAVMSRDFSEDPSAEVLQEGVYVPTASRSSENASENFPYIIVPDSLRPVSNDAAPITVRINFTVVGSMNFGDKKPDYRISLMKQIPPGTTGIIPVKPEFSYRSSFAERFRPLGENISGN